MAVSVLYAGATSTVVGGGGGSGAPLGDNTIWGVDTSADLSSIPTPRTDDQAIAADTGFTWRWSGSAWELIRGTVATTASLPTSNVAGDALFGVGSDGVSAHTYYGRHSGVWARAPRPVPFLWPPVANTGSLQADALFDGDRQATTSPNRVWERVSGAWRVRQATESLASSLPTVDVITGALGFVGTAGYVWTGSAWARSGVTLNQPYARTLSSLQDVAVTDLDGDYGQFNGVSLRLKRAIPLPGGGTANVWVPPVVYAGTITARAYLLGTESNTGLSTTLANQGWTVATAGAGGSINTTAAPGFVRITDSNAGSSSASLGVSAFASGGLAPSTKYYMQGGFRIPLSASGTAAYICSARDGTSAQQLFQGGTGGLQVAADAGNPPSAIPSAYVRSGGSVMPTSGAASVIEVIDEGASVITMFRRDGAPYASVRRNTVASGAASNLFIGDVSGATTGVTIDAQFLYVLTWV